MTNEIEPLGPSIPPDDLNRRLTVARPNQDATLPHLGLVGDTYTILIKGDDTAGKYTLIDMLVPPGGGPPPHRHDFEEMFSVLEGEVEVTFRGEKLVAKAGETGLLTIWVSGWVFSFRRLSMPGQVLQIRGGSSCRGRVGDVDDDRSVRSMSRWPVATPLSFPNASCRARCSAAMN